MPARSPKAEDFKPHWRDVLRVHPAAEMFPLLKESDPDEFAELVKSVKTNGLREIPSVIEEKHSELSLIDGRNRLDALEALGCRFALHRPRRRWWSLLVLHPPEEGEDEELSVPDDIELKRYTYEDPYELVIDLNIRRRHLTPADRRSIIARLLQQNPQRSNRETARLVQTNHHTVGAVRQQMEATGQIAQLTETTGADGRTRRTDRQPRPAQATQPAGSAPHIATASKPEPQPAEPAEPSEPDDPDRHAWELAEKAAGVLLRELGEATCREFVAVFGAPKDADERWHEIGEEILYQLDDPHYTTLFRDEAEAAAAEPTRAELVEELADAKRELDRAEGDIRRLRTELARARQSSPTPADPPAPTPPTRPQLDRRPDHDDTDAEPVPS